MLKFLAPLAAFAVLIGAVLYLLFGTFGPPVPLHIVSGSENRALEPLIMEWAEDNNVEAQITYKGSVDISRALTEGKFSEYDAAWPAHSLWIELGDTERVVKHTASVLQSPVVLGLRKSIAQELGWIDRDDITIQDIEAASQNGHFRLAMTSATQSNSGASAYFGFLHAMAGTPGELTLDHLAHADTQDGVRNLLAQVDRSSGSSGWLADAVVENPRAFDAMFNYEALIIEANKALVAANEEPLYVIYPANGLSVADSPLGYIDKADPDTEAVFQELQAFLRSEEAVEFLLGLGRRAGAAGSNLDAVDLQTWNPDWGIDLTRSVAAIPTPAADVIAEALRLYQSELRKPSLTVWVLDVSGSMEGEPIAELKRAMELLLDPQAAAMNLLQSSDQDITIILPFNNNVLDSIHVSGTDDVALQRALRFVNNLTAEGGTDVYYALYEAFEALRPFANDETLKNYLPAVVAMTDGASDESNRSPLLAHMDATPYTQKIPIHAIAFGNADEAQLKELSALSIGRLFRADGDLAKALRAAKGYN